MPPPFCFDAFKLIGQNEFKPTIRQRFGEETPRRGVTFLSAELASIQ